MGLPEFTAEASLYKTGQIYYMTGTTIPATIVLKPALFLSSSALSNLSQTAFSTLRPPSFGDFCDRCVQSGGICIHTPRGIFCA